MNLRNNVYENFFTFLWENLFFSNVYNILSYDDEKKN